MPISLKVDDNLRIECIMCKCQFTSLLLPSSFLVAYFDCADGENDGDDEEEDASDEAGGHGPPLDVVRNLILVLLADGVARVRVGEHSEQVGFGCTHIFYCNRKTHLV